MVASFAPAPLSIIQHLAFLTIENAFSMNISSAELPYVFLTRGEVEISSSMFLVTVCSAHINVTIRIRDLPLTYQHAFHPLSFKFFIGGKH